MDKAPKSGFKNPPLKTRFKKGQSGNPNGRPLKIKNTSMLLSIELDKLIVVRENGRETKITKREALMTGLVNDAILLVKVLNVSQPVDPFVATDEDKAALDAFIIQATQRNEPSSGGDGNE
jgi:hypothetical protein